jgi:hypothetical protein
MTKSLTLTIFLECQLSLLVIILVLSSSAVLASLFQDISQSRRLELRTGGGGAKVGKGNTRG